MPKAKEFQAALQYLKNKLPQLGMFSTLDELIRAAPQEKMPVQQWQNYLKPGITLQREGMLFPLKAEELQYSGLPEYLSGAGHLGAISKDELAAIAQKQRPDFYNQIGSSDVERTWRELPESQHALYNSREAEEGEINTRGKPPIAAARYAEHAHTPGVPDSYEESITTSPDFGTFPSHFSPQDISWSRTTRHQADLPGNPLTRLIEEIQSDRHEAAAEKINPSTGSSLAMPEGLTTRRGYRTPEEETIDQRRNTQTPLGNEADARAYYGMSENDRQRLDAIRQKPPDTPFKDPADYALLELKKQLLNSVNQGDQYLALTRGADQIARYEQGMGGGRGEGMSHVYDTIYPSALRKLARQYGADVTDVPVKVKGGAQDVRPDTLADYGEENPYDLLSRANDGEDYWRRATSLLDDYQAALRDLPIAHRHLSEADRLHNLANPDNIGEAGRDLDNDEIGKFEEHLGSLHNIWNREMEAGPLGREGMQAKTFPAMHITPEVADRVKKAGVPLFTLAGATAAGLGSDDANANVVEDAAMQNANAGMAEGGKVIGQLAKIVERLGLDESELPRGAKVPSVDFTKGDLQDSGRRVNPESVLKDYGPKNGRASVYRSYIDSSEVPSERLVEEEDAVKGEGDEDPGSRYDWTELSMSRNRNIPPAKIRIAPDGHTEILDGNHRIRFWRDSNQTHMPAWVIDERPGSEVHSELQHHLRNRLENPSGDENVVEDQAIKNANEGEEEHAEGGTVDNTHSSLKALADFARRLGFQNESTEDRARVVTGIAKQLYGLDAQGRPVFGGRAWTSGQGGTPIALLDEIAAIPHSAAQLAALAKSLVPGNDIRNAIIGADPQFSKDAASRLAALDKAVNATAGLKEASTLPEMAEDFGSTIVGLSLPAKLAREGTAVRKALGQLPGVAGGPDAEAAAAPAAVAPPPAFDPVASARARLGMKGPVASRPPLPDNSGADPAIEDAAMRQTNEGMAGGGAVTRRALLKLLGAGAAAIPVGAKLLEKETTPIARATAMTSPEGFGRRYVPLYSEPGKAQNLQGDLARHLEEIYGMEPEEISQVKLVGSSPLRSSGFQRATIEAPQPLLDKMHEAHMEEFGNHMPIDRVPEPEWATHPDEVPGKAHPVHNFLQAIKDSTFGESDEPNWERVEALLPRIPGHEKALPKYQAMKDVFHNDLSIGEDVPEDYLDDRVNAFHQALDDLSAEHGVPIARDPNAGG